MLEQGKFGKKKKLHILLRPEHSKVSTVYILRTLLVRPEAFRWDQTGVESFQMVVEARDIKAVDIYESSVEQIKTARKYQKQK